jgi:hypothetical protein
MPEKYLKYITINFSSKVEEHNTSQSFNVNYNLNHVYRSSN